MAKLLYDVIGKRYIYEIYSITCNATLRCCKVHVLIMYSKTLDKTEENMDWYCVNHETSYS